MSKIALCAIGRLENRYAREFVEHYQNLGVDKIFIYDNNHFNEEFFQEVLQDYIDEGFVEIIDFRDRVQAQNAAYNDCYAKHKNEFNAFIMVDIDEFLILEKHKTIGEYIESFPNDWECILINWQCMTSNGLIEYENKPLMERFTKACDKDIKVQYAWGENMHVKSIIKGGLPFVCYYGNPHVPTNPLNCYNADGRRCSQTPFQLVTWETAYLKHFVTKSLQEYVENKCARGTGDRDYNTFKTTYKGRFFKYNKPSKKQFEWLQKHNIEWI